MDALPQPGKRGLSALPGDEDDPTRPHDPLVASVMEEVKAAKRAKKEHGPSEGRKGKKAGLTLEEVERQEGGTIKESQVGMAATRRADRRKQKTARDETEMLAVSELIDVEEALEQEQDDGMKLEPFNLAKEREEGHFDEGGNYVEHKEEDDPSMKDAWLTSNDAAVLSDEARRKVEEQKARMASAEAAPEITARQAADLMRELIEILQPGETAMKALRRLGPQTSTAKKSKKNQPKDAKEPRKEMSEADVEAKHAFEKLTEAASTLMDSGELDIYSIPREDLEARAKERPSENDDFDMFGDELGGANATSATASAQPEGEKGRGLGDTASPPPSVAFLPPQAIPTAEEEVDYSTWPVKELTRFLKERGQHVAGMTEKAELVAKVREIASKGPEGEQLSAPAGYVWDPSCGLFYSMETGMYYDGASGAFCTPSDGKWWSYDEASGQFQALPAS